MRTLRQSLQEYLAVRRALGTELREAGAVLEQFVSFAQEEGAEWITTELARQWACQPQDVDPGWWAIRLGMVRRFAQYLSAQEPRTEIPPQGLLPHRYSRPSPYIYTDEEIQRLLQATRQLPSPRGLRAKTYTSFFALLEVTGMRVAEAVGLEQEDIDFSRRLITLRRTKLSKHRLLPIHATTCDALREYQSQRERIWPQPETSRFFLSETGRQLNTWNPRDTFRTLSYRIGFRMPSQSRGPRLHDLRHRFAVRTLTQGYRSGGDIETLLPKLATYLGHTHVQDTYWYLTAVPELMQWAVKKLDEQE